MLNAMTNRMFARAAACAALLLLAACNNNRITGCTAYPHPPPPVPTAPTLVAPANGTTGVPTGSVTVVIQAGIPGGQLRLTDPLGGSVTGSTFVPASQATPTYAATAPAAGTAGTLAAHTTYTVNVDYFISQAGDCIAPGAGSVPVQRYTFAIGTFTTQ
jgi:hypothetical protein